VLRGKGEEQLVTKVWRGEKKRAVVAFKKKGRREEVPFAREQRNVEAYSRREDHIGRTKKSPIDESTTTCMIGTQLGREYVSEEGQYQIRKIAWEKRNPKSRSRKKKYISGRKRED